MKHSPQCSYCSPLLLQISASLDNNTRHAECTVRFRWTETSEVFKECRLHGVGTRLMKIHDSGTFISTKALITYIIQWLCLLQVHVYTWWTITPIVSVNAFTFTITTISLRIHVYVYNIWNNPVSFQIFFLDIINMFPVSLLVILCYKTHNSSVTCSNFWKCTPAVMYSCTSLFNLGLCEPFRFWSQVRRQLNCMTMTSQ